MRATVMSNPKLSETALQQEALRLFLLASPDASEEHPEDSGIVCEKKELTRLMSAGDDQQLRQRIGVRELGWAAVLAKLAEDEHGAMLSPSLSLCALDLDCVYVSGGARGG